MVMSSAQAVPEVVIPAEPALDYATRTPVLATESDPIGGGHVPELPKEDRAKKWGFLWVAIALTVAYFFCVVTYWQPIHAGVDQNGYLVGGKQFAETLSMKQAPTMIGQPEKFDPHQFIGAMWVAATNNTQHFYPKY